MAISKKAAPAKEAEKRKPDFVVRAKVKDDVWVTIGAAWSAQLKGGVTGYSLKINTFPAPVERGRASDASASNRGVTLSGAACVRACSSRSISGCGDGRASKGSFGNVLDGY